MHSLFLLVYRSPFFLWSHHAFTPHKNPALDFARRAWLASTSGERWRNWTVSRRRPLTSLSSPPKGCLRRNGHAFSLLIHATLICNIEFAESEIEDIILYIIYCMYYISSPLKMVRWWTYFTRHQTWHWSDCRRPSISTTASLQQAATSDPSTSPGPRRNSNGTCAWEKA